MHQFYLLSVPEPDIAEGKDHHSLRRNDICEASMKADIWQELLVVITNDIEKEHVLRADECKPVYKRADN